MILDGIRSEESGQGMVEYSLILAFVVLFTLGTMRAGVANDLAHRIQYILQAVDF